jgi:hypothetical protein
LTLDPGSRMEKFGSGTDISDPQHCCQVLIYSSVLNSSSAKLKKNSSCGRFQHSA